MYCNFKEQNKNEKHFIKRQIQTYLLFKCMILQTGAGISQISKM